LRRLRILKERQELIHRDPSIPDELAEGSPIQLVVVRNGEVATGRVIVDHVRASVMIINKAKLGKRLPGVLP
jgi:hypothetical protein